MSTQIDALLDFADTGLDEAAEYAVGWDDLDDASKGDFTTGWSLVNDRLAQLVIHAMSGSMTTHQQKQYAALRMKEQRMRPVISKMLAGASG